MHFVLVLATGEFFNKVNQAESLDVNLALDPAWRERVVRPQAEPGEGEPDYGGPPRVRSEFVIRHLPAGVRCIGRRVVQNARYRFFSAGVACRRQRQAGPPRRILVRVV